jgi:hypothetical protein
LFSAPIGTWSGLKTAVAAAAGKTVALTLSTPFDMTGFAAGSAIEIETEHTTITIVGNGAVFDGGGKDRFFLLAGGGKGYQSLQDVALVMSNVRLQNGAGYSPGVGGAIEVEGGTITLSSCSFFGNAALGFAGAFSYGGAIRVFNGTATLSNCIFFSGNTLGGFRGDNPGAGGALYYTWNTGDVGGILLKNCSLLGTVSPKNNDIARQDTTANVTFACADGEVGTPVQMSGTEITRLPALHCT